MKARTVQLGDVATVFNGKTPSKIEQRRVGFPVLKIRDVNEFGQFTGPFTSFVDPDLVAGLAGKLVCDGDTLVLNAAHNADYVASKIFFASGSVVGALATGEWLIIRPDLKETDARFLYFWSQSVESRNRIRDLVKGIHLYPKDVADIPLALPDLSEQQRIAGRLEQADRLVRTRRYALELNDTFLPAAFRQLFGTRLKAGPFRAFGELVKITGGGTPARERPEFYQGRIPWLTSKDMKGDYIWDTEEHITEKAIQESATNLVPAGSILVVVKSKVLMHRLPVAITRVPLCHGQDIKSIQCSGRLQPAFARFVLKFHEGRLLNLARGANTEGLTLPMLEELPVPTVPPSEQEHFAELATRHECLRTVQREALRQAEHLFASLLARAFAAESPSESGN